MGVSSKDGSDGSEGSEGKEGGSDRMPLFEQAKTELLYTAQLSCLSLQDMASVEGVKAHTQHPLHIFSF